MEVYYNRTRQCPEINGAPRLVWSYYTCTWSKILLNVAYVYPWIFVEARYKRSKVQKKYQEYDQNIVSQRKNRPRLKLNDFNLLRTLGTGSFGRVHLAQSRHNARYYAIKVLKKTEVVRLKQGINWNWIQLPIYANLFALCSGAYKQWKTYSRRGSQSIFG